MRDKIAKEACENYRGTGAWESCSEGVKDFWRFIANQILHIVREGIGKMESTVTEEEPAYYRGFEDAQEAFLKVLE